jgi:hypothetical protein
MCFLHRLLGAVPFVLCASGVNAQVYLHGRVLEDASGLPVAEATVILQDERGRDLQRQVADDDGGFAFAVTGNGPVRLRAERLGYRRATTPPLHFEGYTVFTVEVRLDVAAVLLAPLTVLARSRGDLPAPTLAGFERRRQSGYGWYLTRAEIARRNASRATDLLTAAPGVALQPARGTNRSAIYMDRSGSRCAAQIFIDGFHVNRRMGMVPGRRGGTAAETVFLDEMVQPAAIEGIEVYQGLSRLPPEFVTPDSRCGVVAVWTRRGG